MSGSPGILLLPTELAAQGTASMSILTAEAEQTAAAEVREARAHTATYGRLPKWPQGIRSCRLCTHPVPSNIEVSRGLRSEHTRGLGQRLSVHD